METGSWGKGSYASAVESLLDDFRRHGVEVGANEAAEYLRKAEGFAQESEGCPTKPRTWGHYRCYTVQETGQVH